MASPYNIVFNAQLQADPAAATRAAQTIQSAFKNINVELNVNTRNLQNGLNNITSGAKASQNALQAAKTEAASFNTTLSSIASSSGQVASSLSNLANQAGLAARRFLAFSLAAGAMVELVTATKRGVAAAVEFQLSMNKVLQVSSATEAKIDELKSTISGLSTSLGVSSAALAETAITLKQAGFTATQTKAALEALALTDLAPTFDDMKQSTEGLIAAFRQFGLQSGDFKNALSSINSVSAAFAVESSDIITAIQKAGGAFKISAGDMKSGTDALNEFTALFTSVRDTTRESADSIATGLRTIFTRLQRQDTVKALKDLGVELRYTQEEANKLGRVDLENQFVGAYEAVKRLSTGLAGLRTTDPRYSQVVEQLGGYRQISRVIPLLQEFTTAQKALNVAQAGQISLQVAAEQRQGTLAAKVNKLKEEYLDLFRKIVDSNGFQSLANSLINVASAFAKVLDVARPLLPLLSSLAALKVAINIGSIVGSVGRSFTGAPGQNLAPRKLASGGYIDGIGNSDSEPALLTPGEFVLNKRAVAKMGVPALRDLNEGRGKVKFSRYANGSINPVGDDVVTTALDTVSTELEAERLKRQRALELLARVKSTASVSGGASSLIDKLRKGGSSPIVPTVQSGLSGFSASGGKLPTTEDTSFTSIDALIKNDINETGASHEKSVRNVIDIDNNTLKEVDKSFTEKLKEAADYRKAFFFKNYDLALNTANKLGGSGVPAGVDVAHIAGEALAKLSIEGEFSEDTVSYEALTQGGKLKKNIAQLDSPREKDLVQKYVASALAKEIRKAKLSGEIHTPIDSSGQVIEFASKEGEASQILSTPDATDNLIRVTPGGRRKSLDFSTQEESDAIRASNVRNLQGVVGPLPEGPHVHAQLVGKALELGAAPAQVYAATGVNSGKTGTINDVIANQVINKLGIKDTGSVIQLPPTLGGGSGGSYGGSGGGAGGAAASGGDANNIRKLYKTVADGVHRVSADELPEFGRALKLNTIEFTNLANNARTVAEESGKLGSYYGGLSDILIRTKGGLANIIGIQNKAEVRNPLAAQVENYVNYGTRAVVTGGDRTIRDKANARKFQDRDIQLNGLTNDEYDYQARQLAAAQQKYGSEYGEQSGIGRTLLYGPFASEELRAQRAANKPGVDPLLIASANRGSRFEESVRQKNEAAIESARVQREQQTTAGAQLRVDEAAQEAASARNRRRFAANNVNRLGTASREVFDLESDNVVSRSFVPVPNTPISRRNFRQNQGGITDQLALKEQALEKARNGGLDKEYYNSIKGVLSPQQLKQVELADAGRGKGTPFFSTSSGTRLKYAADSLSQYRANGVNLNETADSFGEVKIRGLKLADERIATRGGSNVLSKGTTTTITNQALLEEENKVKRELLSAQKNLLSKLYPSISVVELNKKATEDVNSALAGQAKVVRSASGKLLGLENTVNQATGAGISAPGAGGVGYSLSSRFGGAIDSIRNRVATPTGVGQRLDGLLQRSGVGYGLAGLAVGGTFVADRIASGGGTAEDTSRTAGGTARYERAQAASGGLQGALLGASIGAAIGSVVPVIGTAIGGLAGVIVGGTAGLYTALKDAEKDIRQAKINNSLVELSDKLSSFSTGIPDINTTVATRNLVNSYQSASSARALESASHTFSGLDVKEYSELKSADLRKEIGPLLPQISQGLTNQVALITKGGGNRKADDLLEQFKNGAEGINKEFIVMIARLRGIPIVQVEEEYKKALILAQANANREIENKNAGRTNEQTLNSFGRLVISIESASSSLDTLRRSASLLGDFLDGTIKSTRVNAGSDNLDQLGGLDRQGLKAIDLVSRVGGDQGSALRRTADAASSVRTALDFVLPQVLATQGVDERDVNSRVSSGIYKQLGVDPKNASKEVQDVVANVLAELNNLQSGGKEFGGILDKAKTDIGKLNDSLISKSLDPIKEFGGKAARLLEDNANKFIESLTELYQRTQAVGQLYDQLANVQQNNFRQGLQFQADKAGRSGQAIDFANLGQLERGFNSRQQRLTGVNDNRAVDSNFIAQQLVNVRQQIGAAEAQQNAFEATGGKGEAFQGAANNLLQLKTQASNLQQALKNLADQSDRNAAIQEKLNRLNQEKDSRLGLAERFVTADATEQNRINRGFDLSKRAAAAGNLDSFSNDERRLIVETLKSAAGATLSGFNGAPRADDLLKNLLSNSFGGAFKLNPQQQGQENELKKILIDRGQQAETAVTRLIEGQEAGNNTLFENLKTQQATFFAKLEQVLVRDKLSQANVNLGQAQARQTELKLDQGASASILNRVGVRTSEQFNALKDRKADIIDLSTALNNNRAANSRIDTARRNLSQFGAQSGKLAVLPFLESQGFDANETKRIIDGFQQESNTSEYRARRNEIKGISDPNERNLARDAQDREILGRLISKEKIVSGGLVQTTLAQANDAQRKLTGIQGVSPQAIRENLSTSKGTADFFKALDSFDNAGNKIEDFGKKFAAAGKEVEKFQQEVNLLRQALLAGTPAPVVAKKAFGGNIFQPSGTDTVPAMLTPGEFVVNARSAKANAKLLEEINRSHNDVRGPSSFGFGDDSPIGGPASYSSTNRRISPMSYFADGGKVGLKYRELTPEEKKSYEAFKAKEGLAQLEKEEGIKRKRKEESIEREKRINAELAKQIALTRAANSTPASKSTFNSGDFRTPQIRRPKSSTSSTIGSFRPARYTDDDYKKDKQSLETFGENLRGIIGEAGYEQLKKRIQREEQKRIFANGPQSSKELLGFFAQSDPSSRSAQNLIVGNAVQKENKRIEKDEAQYQKDKQALLAFGDNLDKIAGKKEADAIRRRVGQEDLNRKNFGGAQEAANERLANVGAKAAGRFAVNASIDNFNKASFFANNQSRLPGADGQRNVASRVTNVQTQSLAERFQNDDLLRRFTAQGINPELNKKEFFKLPRFANGGYVGGAGVGDTVPALLSSGEFVLNGRSTARIGVHNLQKFNNGGLVGTQKLAEGGNVASSSSSSNSVSFSSESIQAMNSLTNTLTQFGQGADAFGQSAQQLIQTFNIFSGTANALAQAISNMPKTLTITGQHQVNVVLVGAESLSKITPELQNMVTNSVKEQLSRIFKNNMPEAGVDI